jgi:lipoate---protein ligase
MNWRLIEFQKNNGAMQMAIDEAILISRAKNSVPNTLRFYAWNPRAITVGFFQDIDEEVDKAQAEKMKVDIVRRYTGGGAVFHDQEITYSIIVSEKDVSDDIVESYRQICAGVINGLREIGLDAQFSPINDILINNKKISGNAQTRKMGVVLQHGTILMDIDVKKMFSLLKVPDEKIKDKLIKNVEERVTSIYSQLNKKVDLKEMERALSLGFEKTFKIKLLPSDLSRQEIEQAEKLYREKYLSKKWNYWR